MEDNTAHEQPREPRRFAHSVLLRREMREEYLRLHSAVWPEVESRITASNIRNYSIFVLGNTLFSYYEYVGEDIDADLAAIAADPATQAWWRLTDPCQVAVGGSADGERWIEAAEVWHLP